MCPTPLESDKILRGVYDGGWLLAVVHHLHTLAYGCLWLFMCGYARLRMFCALFPGETFYIRRGSSQKYTGICPSLLSRVVPWFCF